MSRQDIKTIIFLTFLLLAIPGCGDDDDHNDLTPNVAGVWNLSANLTSNSCPVPATPIVVDQFSITQNGNALTAVDTSGAPYTGSITGNTIRLSLATPTTETEDSCTLTGDIDVLAFVNPGEVNPSRATGTLSFLFTSSGSCALPINCRVDHSLTMERAGVAKEQPSGYPGLRKVLGEMMNRF
ncbi:MAG TPA: hypothetical protein VNM22_06770 [Candidatus Limnocylindrales bacterium]|nr:hypothetical protein [Candidatus Limnocylindrales bacterium]